MLGQGVEFLEFLYLVENIETNTLQDRIQLNMLLLTKKKKKKTVFLINTLLGA